MTALAAALVLCCAMVCGTVLALRRLARRMEDVTIHASIVEAERSLAMCVEEIRVLRSELDALKARDALRGM